MNESQRGVIPTGATRMRRAVEGPAVHLPRSQPSTKTANLSSRPERTRISCIAALDTPAYAPFRKERRTRFAQAATPHRKSGVAQWRDLRFTSTRIQVLPSEPSLAQETQSRSSTQ